MNTSPTQRNNELRLLYVALACLAISFGLILSQNILELIISGWWPVGINVIKQFAQNSALFVFCAALLTEPNTHVALQTVATSFLYLPLIAVLLMSLSIGLLGAAIFFLAMSSILARFKSLQGNRKA